MLEYFEPPFWFAIPPYRAHHWFLGQTLIDSLPDPLLKARDKLRNGTLAFSVESGQTGSAFAFLIKLIPE